MSVKKMEPQTYRRFIRNIGATPTRDGGIPKHWHILTTLYAPKHYLQERRYVNSGAISCEMYDRETHRCIAVIEVEPTGSLNAVIR